MATSTPSCSPLPSSKSSASCTTWCTHPGIDAKLGPMPLDDTGDRRRARNVLGGALEICSLDPRTGFTRSGCCETGPEDVGSHTVCAEMTAEFLAFSRASGNDLSTPRPEWGFAGLQPGDRWCVCAARWLEAYRAGVPAPVILGATHERALEVVPIEALMAHVAAP